MPDTKRFSVPMLCLGVMLAALLVVGSICDFSLADSLYTGAQPLWGGVFAAIGELPSFCGIAVGCLFFLTDRGGKCRGKTIVLRIVAVCLTLVAMLLALREAREGLPNVPTLLLSLGIAAVFVLSLLYAQRLYRAADRAEALRFAVLTLVFCILTLAVVNGLKYVWCRPRMRLLRADTAVEFQNWWQIGREQMKQFTAQGVARSEFRSMPSGHASGAACSLLWCLLPTLRGKRPSLLGFFASVVFTLLVSLSRIVMGAHFLSDLTVAWIITYVFFLLTVFLMRRGGKCAALSEKLLA